MCFSIYQEHNYVLPPFLKTILSCYAFCVWPSSASCELEKSWIISGQLAQFQRKVYPSGSPTWILQTKMYKNYSI